MTSANAEQAAQEAEARAAQTGTAADRQAAAEARARADAEKAKLNDTTGGGISAGAGNSVDQCGYAEILQPWDWFRCGVRAVLWLVLGFAALLLYISGVLLNLSVLKTIFEFSSLIGNSDGLLLAWRILRDLGNMFLLFGFIFIGLATILDLQTYSAKKALPRLIIFAILMNFSLFAAEAVIDVSNGLSTAIYTQSSIDANCAASEVGGGSALGECATTSGIASRLLQASGIAHLYGMGVQGGGDLDTDIGVSTSAYFGLIVLATVAAVVLFAAAIMLLVRAITLTFLMVVAPIGFAALAVPSLEKIGRDWWSKLLNQAFFAPILLLFILISLKITEGLATQNSRDSMAAALSNGNTGSVGTILVFAIVIGFLIASLAAAKKFGAMGGTFAVNMGTKFVFGSYARGASLAVGGASFGAQRLIQRKAPDSAAGRFIVNRALRPLAQANMDLRRLPGMGAALGALGATATATKPSEHTSFQDMRHQYQDFRDRKRGKELDALYDKEVATLNLVEELRNGSPLSPESERLLANLSADEIAADHDLQHSIEELAHLLSTEQFEGMMKSDKLDPRTKGVLAHNRFEQTRAAIAGGYGNAASRTAIRNLSTKDLEQLAKYDPAAFDDLLQQYDPVTGESMLSNDQNDALGKSNALTNTQRQNVRNQSRVGRIESAVTSRNYTQARAFTVGMSSKSKAKLNPDSLTRPEIIETFTSGDLAEIQREGKLSAADVHTIAMLVKDPAHPNYTTLSRWFAGKPDADAYWS